MTKKKTGVFTSAWMDGRVPEKLIRQRLANETSANIATDPVLAALRRALEVWRFNQSWRATEPPPAAWAGLIAAIEVPVPMTVRDAIELRSRVWKLPRHVLAFVDHHLFLAAEIGRVALFKRLYDEPTDADAALLRDTLRDIHDGLRLMSGKRGPKQDTATPLRAVAQAIANHSSMKAVPARDLAADLLRICGIPAPEGRSQLAALVGGSGKGKLSDK